MCRSLSARGSAYLLERGRCAYFTNVLSVMLSARGSAYLLEPENEWCYSEYLALGIRPFKIDCVFCIKNFSKSYVRGRKHSTDPWKKHGSISLSFCIKTQKIQ